MGLGLACLVAALVLGLRLIGGSGGSATGGRPMTVQRVVDGDTVKLAAPSGGTVTVRVLGIDTPETVDPRKGVGCFGPQASAWAKRELSGKRVRVRTDPSQDTRDKYGRLLAYLTLPDGTDYSIEAAREGYAKAYVYDTPVAEAARIGAAEKQAHAAARGLWGPPCDGHTAAGPKAAEPNTNAPAPHVQGRCEPGYSPCLPVTGDLDCSEIGHRVRVSGDDPYRLDGNGDGHACG
jgi:micrococcal nuclease